MAEKGHVHKFRRHTYKSGNVTYFCALPDCAVKVNPALALGKRSTCWRCGEPFIMNEYSIRLAKPHCEKCHKPKEKRTGERSYDDETPKEIKILSVPLESITIEPLSGQAHKDSVSDLRFRLSGISHVDDEGDI